jgi:hypothetical protein
VHNILRPSLPCIKIRKRFRKRCSKGEIHKKSSENFWKFKMDSRTNNIYAEVVTFAAGSLEAEGLPGYPQVLVLLK